MDLTRIIRMLNPKIPSEEIAFAPIEMKMKDVFIFISKANFKPKRLINLIKKKISNSEISKKIDTYASQFLKIPNKADEKIMREDYLR